MKRIRWDEPTDIRLTQKERDLILNRTFAEGDVRKRIEACAKTGDGKVSFQLTSGQLNELLEWIAERANHSSDRSLVSSLDALYDKLERVESSLDVQD